MTAQMQEHMPRDLGDGIVLRAATEADIDAVVDLSATMFFPSVGEFVRRIMTQGIPRGDLSSFLVCEDTTTRRVVSSLALLQNKATYGGVPLTIGQPEFVVTLPEYRGRGLIRAQFEAIHARSAARGDLMQIIQGIPNYYRQFGYEYALERSTGVRKGFFADLPQPQPDAAPAFHLRPVAENDIPFLLALAETERSRYLIRQVQDEPYWHSIIARSQSEDPASPIAAVIITTSGDAAGFLLAMPDDEVITISAYETLPPHGWALLQPTTFGALLAQGWNGAIHARAYLLNAGTNHPLSSALAAVTRPVPHPTSSQWYVRVPDIPAFVQRIGPVLEARLAQSPFAGYTGSVRISFYYRAGLRIDFTGGKLTRADFWHPEYGRPGISNMTNHPADASDAAFPGLTFIQLLMGYRSLGELAYAFPDVQWVDDPTHMLLAALFPKMPSFIL